MSAKSLEICVRELNSTVLKLQDKVNSLEALIIEQNTIIKNLAQVHQDSKAGVLGRSTDHNKYANEGTKKQRPIREAQHRAVSANAAPKRKVRATRDMSPALSSLPTSHNDTNDVYKTPTTSAPTDNAVEANESHDNDNAWVTVRPKRVRRLSKNVACGTAAPGTMEMEASERKSYLHLYYLKSGTTVEQVVRHLLSICPNDSCFAEPLKARGDYASFKLTVPTKHLDIYMSPDHWTENVHIKPWRSGFRKENISKTNA